MRWIIGLVGLIVALILVAYGVARTETRDGRCLELADRYGWSAVTIDTGTGRMLLDHRTKNRKLMQPPIAMSPDRRHMLTWQLTVAATGSQLSWKVAYPPHMVLLDTAAGQVGSVNWSPDSLTASYFLQSRTLTTWNLLDVRDGQVRPIMIQGVDEDYIWKEIAGVEAWSPDSRTLAVVRSKSNDAPARLYLRERDSSEFHVVDLPNLTGAFTIKWSPNGQTLALMGSNRQSSEGLIVIYSHADGRVIFRSGKNPYQRERRQTALDIFWSPDSRYFFTANTYPFTGKREGWDVYGIDGSTIRQVVDGDHFITWRQSDSRLVIQTGNTQVIDLDPATGAKTPLVDKVLDVKYFQGQQAAIIASTQADGGAAIDLLDLRTGAQTRVMSHISQFERFETRDVALGIEGVAWTARSQFHLTFLDRSGQIRQDFTGLDPYGQIFGRFGSDLVMYARGVNAANAETSTPVILNVLNGERHPLKMAPIGLYGADEEPSTGRFLVFPMNTDSFLQRIFTSDGDLVPLGDILPQEYVSVAPNNMVAVGWVDGAPIELHLASGERRTVPTRLSASYLLKASWWPDSSAFALIQSTTIDGTLWRTRVEIYSVEGEFRARDEVTTDLDLDQIRWTDCS